MKRKRQWWLLAGGLLAVLLVLAIACDDDDEEGGVTPAAGETPTAAELQTDVGVTDTEIILGQHTVQSGSLAAVFQPIAPAMLAYFDKVNTEDGGVCDRSIRLIVEDDQYDPATALERARKLVEQDGILAFVGNLGSPPNLGSIDFINDPNEDGDTSDGIPDLWLSTGLPIWNDPEKWPWTTGYIPDYISEGQVLGTYAQENFSGETVAILYQADLFGETGRDGFKATFEGEVVAEESYEATATEVTSQLANLRDADPGIIYLYSTPAFTAQVYAYMAANDWNPQVVQSYVNSPSTLAFLVGGDAGVEAGFQQIAGAISTTYLLDPIGDVDDPAVVEHVRIMEAFNGPDLTSLSIYGQSLAELVVETLQVACDNNDMTRAGTLAAAESLQGFSTSVLQPGVEVNTSPTDHFALQALVPIEIQANGVLLVLGEVISVE